jgi:hypothetical protein
MELPTPNDVMVNKSITSVEEILEASGKKVALDDQTVKKETLSDKAYLN